MSGQIQQDDVTFLFDFVHVLMHTPYPIHRIECTELVVSLVNAGPDVVSLGFGMEFRGALFGVADNSLSSTLLQNISTQLSQM